MDFEHVPVLLDETLESLKIKKDGIYVDGTLGGAGHSLEIVKKLDTGRLIGIDQDTNALKKSKEILGDYDNKVTYIHDNYINIENVLDGLNIDKIDGMLLDIGVSSHQLDEGSRGFSYHQDARLDMRMDRSQNLSAWNVVNEYSKDDLERIILEYGEERWAKRIAEFIVSERKELPIDTTLELVEVLKKAIPIGARRNMPHPGRKTFQALRIEVNKELEVLERVIPKIVSRLKKGGRLSIITFHSLEDRIVKNIFRDLFLECICPPEIPICQCDKKREVNIITRRPIVASEKEIKNNPRSRSAKLRVVEKI